MDPSSRREFLQGILAAGGAALLPPSLWAQVAQGGTETRLEPFVTGEELTSQPGLWVMEVFFKPLRMIYIDHVDPRTGATQKRLVWYQCYRAINRALGGKANDLPPPPRDPDPTDRPPMFVPEFMIVTDDNDGKKRYIDRVVPGALEVINRRERGSYKNAVDVVGPIPAVAAADEKSPEQIFGVATWRNVDPRTDFFQVFVTGFSNGFKVVAGPDGEESVQRKTIVREYWRPGDEFEQEESEIRPKSLPRWIYR